MYRSNWLVSAVALSVAACLIAAPPAKELPRPSIDRYELGRRLRAFEEQWDRTTDAAARKAAAERFAEVHPQFLTLRFADAARTLDLATHRLTSDDPPSLTRQWASSLAAAADTRLVDGAAKELAVTVRPHYALRGDPPKGLEIQLWFSDKQITAAKPTDFPFTAKVPLPPLGDFRGLDRKLYFMVEAGKVIRRYPVGVSQVDKLAERLVALKAAAAGWKELATIEQATVRDRVPLLAGLMAGDVPETDLPAAGLLANAEGMLDGKPFFTHDRPGEFWLSVPLGGTKSAPLRVFVPRGLDPTKSVPVVVGLHGAGGSENVFFEAYGAGRAVAECRRRGWVFVATRSGLDFAGGPPVVAILDQLAKRYPLDPKRTLLVGHSMGATQVIALAQKHPARFAAVAALGGGGIVTDPKAFATLPVFVAAGEKDFGLGYAKELNKALAAAGAKAVTFKEYPDIEHMLIVREALPDVFALFDRVAGP